MVMEFILEDLRDVVSKKQLTASYVHASLVPILDFGVLVESLACGMDIITPSDW